MKSQTNQYYELKSTALIIPLCLILCSCSSNSIVNNSGIPGKIEKFSSKAETVNSLLEENRLLHHILTFESNEEPYQVNIVKLQIVILGHTGAFIFNGCLMPSLNGKELVWNYVSIYEVTYRGDTHYTKGKSYDLVGAQIKDSLLFDIRSIKSFLSNGQNLVPNEKVTTATPAMYIFFKDNSESYNCYIPSHLSVNLYPLFSNADYSSVEKLAEGLNDMKMTPKDRNTEVK